MYCCLIRWRSRYSTIQFNIILYSTLFELQYTLFTLLKRAQLNVRLLHTAVIRKTIIVFVTMFDYVTTAHMFPHVIWWPFNCASYVSAARFSTPSDKQVSWVIVDSNDFTHYHLHTYLLNVLGRDLHPTWSHQIYAANGLKRSTYIYSLTWMNCTRLPIPPQAHVTQFYPSWVTMLYNNIAGRTRTYIPLWLTN